MADNLDLSEIKKRSIKGAKWLFVMNSVGIFLSFLITLILGRIGPAALGKYAIAQVLVSIIATFIIYGGPPVLSVFLPKISDPRKRGKFLFTYLTIIISFMIIVLAVFWFFPTIFNFLLQTKFNMKNYGWFILLSIFVITYEFFYNTASGMLLIKLTAIARQMMRTVLLPIVVVLFCWKPSLLSTHGTEVIFGGYFAGYLLGAIICLIGIVRDLRFKLRLGWMLPPGFLSLSLATMVDTILLFLYANFDRIAVLYIEDLEGLGMYQAVIILNSLIRIFPQMLGSALIPMFSSLIAKGENNAARKAYYALQKYGTIIMVCVALLLISYSREFLSLYGDNYSTYSYILSIFCVSATATTLFFGNTPVLIAYEKNVFRACVVTIQITFQILGTIFFVKTFGILAIVLSKVIFVILANIFYTIFVLFKMNLGFKIPRAYIVGILVSILAAIARNILLSQGFALSTAVFILSLTLFVILSGINASDFRKISSLMFNKKM